MPEILPLVTIGIPLYNGAVTLRESLDSLQRQNYPNVEIVVLDNASTDESAAIVREYAADAPNIRYFRNEMNIGSYPNFLNIVDLANGKYFCWAAHDDLWSVNYISRLVDALEKNPESGLATPLTVFLESDLALSNRFRPHRPARGLSPLGNFKDLLEDNASGWIYGLYRTSWLQERKQSLPCFPSIPGSDLVWLARNCLNSRYVGCNEAVFYNRLHAGTWNYALKSNIRKIRYCFDILFALSRASLAAPLPLSDRIVALSLSFRFVLRFCGGIASRKFGNLWKKLMRSESVQAPRPQKSDIVDVIRQPNSSLSESRKVA